MEDDISDMELFWDRITRERMSEVGEDAPFDFMYRGEFIPEKNTISSIKLGGEETSVEAAMVNVNIGDCYIKIYDVESGRSRQSFGPDFSVQNSSELARMLDGTENDEWGYEAARIWFDPGRRYEKPEDGLVQGPVYCPESTRGYSEQVMRDLERIFGQNMISEL